MANSTGSATARCSGVCLTRLFVPICGKQIGLSQDAKALLLWRRRRGHAYSVGAMLALAFTSDGGGDGWHRRTRGDVAGRSTGGTVKSQPRQMSSLEMSETRCLPM
ncbi:MAG: hypothetical protein RLZ98_165 [Pseudomonadota bacterium]|jgi:hypothetical protein